MNAAQAHVSNIRDFSWYEYGGFSESYSTREIDAKTLTGVVLYHIPYKLFGVPIVHTMLAFEFSDGEPLVLSVETRREVGETYSLWRGFFREYELHYVLGTEWDLVRKRVLKGDAVYKYQIHGTRAEHEVLLHKALERVESLSVTPEFYNTATASCTTEIIDLLHHAYGVNISKVLFSVWPQGFDRYLWWTGRIDTKDVDFKAYRNAQRVDEYIRGTCPQAEGFSSCIRMQPVL
jgi:hypothetical protein